LEKIFQENEILKIAGVVISGKVHFKLKTLKQDKGHYIMIKLSTHQEDITIINTYALNIGAPKYIKLILIDLNEKLDYNTIIVVDIFNNE
jgi:hypothetical protein